MAQEKLAKVDESIADCREQAAMLETKLADTLSSIEKLRDTELSQLVREIESAEDEVYASFAQAVNISDVRRFEEVILAFIIVGRWLAVKHPFC